MVSDVQAKDDFVQFGFFDSDSLVAEGWWKLSKEVGQSDGSHVELSHGVVFRPGVLEGLDIFLLKSKDVVLVFCSLIVVETLADNSNENIHENEEGNELEQEPVEHSNKSLTLKAIVHDSIPRLTCRCSPKSHHRQVESSEAHILANEVACWHLSEKTHACDTKSEENKHKKCSCVQNVSERHEKCFQKCSKTLRCLNHSQQSGNSDNTESSWVEVKSLQQVLVQCNQRHHNNNEIKFVPVDIPVIFEAVSCDLQGHLQGEEDHETQI